MTEAAPIYRAIMLEIERRRHQLACPMWKVDEASGIQEHYYGKMQAVDAKSGRQARWDTLQLVLDALFPGGFDVSITPTNKGTLTAIEYRRLLRVSAAGTDRKLMRALMTEIGKLGGSARRSMLAADERAAIASTGARAMHARRSREQRKEAGRKAAQARWNAMRAKGAKQAQDDGPEKPV